MGPIRPLGVLWACLALAGAAAWSAEPQSRVVFASPPSDASVPEREEPEESDEPDVELAQATPAARPAQTPPPTARPATPPTTQPPAAGAPSARATPPTPAATAPPPPAPAPGLARGADVGAAGATDRSLLGGLTYNTSPIMLGDQAPLTTLRILPNARLGPPPNPITPIPPRPPFPGRVRIAGAAVVPSVRGFKVADNQSPAPQDRVFLSFNNFYNVNDTVNRQLGSAVNGVQVYREILGLEKTFMDGQGSIGLRMPINSLYANSGRPSLQGMNTALGDLSVFGKYVLWRDDKTGSLISGGLSVTAPNGPAHFAGSPVGFGFRDVQLQPFIGFFFAFDKLYIQGFTAIDVPTNPHDVTLYYNDLGVGYFLYRSQDPHAFFKVFAPTFEVHINDPLNHRGALRINDPAGTADIVDLTYGANMVFGQRTLVSAALVTPITGPRPFDVEFALLVNVYFGKSKFGARRGPIYPPVLTGAP